jgi:hypothetical protein
MQIGGIGALVPERRNDLAKLGIRAMLAGTMANLISASIAGMFLGYGKKTGLRFFDMTEAYSVELRGWRRKRREQRDLRCTKACIWRLPGRALRRRLRFALFGRWARIW